MLYIESLLLNNSTEYSGKGIKKIIIGTKTKNNFGNYINSSKEFSRNINPDYL